MSGATQPPRRGERSSAGRGEARHGRGGPRPRETSLDVVPLLSPMGLSFTLGAGGLVVPKPHVFRRGFSARNVASAASAAATALLLSGSVLSDSDSGETIATAPLRRGAESITCEHAGQTTMAHLIAIKKKKN